jgi:thiol-disulfide isomerase/thioredoxin
MRRFLWLALFALIVSACTVAPSEPATEGGSPTASPTGAPPTAEPTETEEPTSTPAPQAAEDLPSGARSEFETDFSKHIVPYSEISTVLSKDRIPAIDDPRFIGIDEADEWLASEEPVLMLEIGGEARAYPIQILMWHEIVNDVVGGTPVAATYCPLCNTGIVFERTVDGEVLDFGTTGRLRFSNLVMYDRQTESWWQQASGKAIVGEFTDTQLTILPSTMISWGDFKAKHPEGQVLSRETGHTRDYGTNPYTGYDEPGRTPFLYRGPETPEELRQNARVLGIELNGEPIAYPYDRLENVRAANDTVGGVPIVVLWQPGTASALDSARIAAGDDVGAAAAFSRELDDRTLTFAFVDGRIVDQETGSEWNIFGEAVAGSLEGRELESVVSVDHFWFSWAAFQPETRVYDPAESTSSGSEGLAGQAEGDLEADFEINLYQGEDVLGGASVAFSNVLAQGKPVVLNMWAGLCPICRNELPELQQAYETYGDQVLFIGVDVGPFVGLGSREDGRALLDELGITFPAGSTPDPQILRDYDVLGTPTTHFVTPSGESIQRRTGPMSEEQLHENIEALIEASGGS